MDTIKSTNTWTGEIKESIRNGVIWENSPYKDNVIDSICEHGIVLANKFLQAIWSVHMIYYKHLNFSICIQFF